MSHVDLALTVVEDRSPALADLVSRNLMIGDNAPQKAYTIPAAMAQHDPVMAKFERWIRSHLDQPILISAAAYALGVTERGLQRAAAATLGMTPMDFVNEIRLAQRPTTESRHGRVQRVQGQGSAVVSVSTDRSSHGAPMPLGRR